MTRKLNQKQLKKLCCLTVTIMYTCIVECYKYCNYLYDSSIYRRSTPHVIFKTFMLHKSEINRARLE